MKKLFLYWLIPLLFLSCLQKDNILSADIEGYYSYVSFDKNGNVIVEGWLTINFKDSTNFSGKWDFKKVGDPEDIGPQVGSGDHMGGLIGNDSLWIELNPQFRDNNLLLIGKFKDNKIEGTWQWISFIGPTNEGEFRAEK